MNFCGLMRPLNDRLVRMGDGAGFEFATSGMYRLMAVAVGSLRESPSGEGLGVPGWAFSWLGESPVRRGGRCAHFTTVASLTVVPALAGAPWRVLLTDLLQKSGDDVGSG